MEYLPRIGEKVKLKPLREYRHGSGGLRGGEVGVVENVREYHGEMTVSVKFYGVRRATPWIGLSREFEYHPYWGELRQKKIKRR